MPARLAPGAMERARLNAGLSLPEVAVHMRRGTAACRRWETGRATPHQDTLIELARLYGVSPAELI